MSSRTQNLISNRKTDINAGYYTRQRISGQIIVLKLDILLYTEFDIQPENGGGYNGQILEWLPGYEQIIGLKPDIKPYSKFEILSDTGYMHNP